jgi:hypothetical protein
MSLVLAIRSLSVIVICASVIKSSPVQVAYSRSSVARRKCEIDQSLPIPEGATMTTHVTETSAAPSELAVRHFEEMLAFETDCWDVNESLKSSNTDFIVIYMCTGRTLSRRAM